jgi:uncharacterized protein with beta-barrel porin domain
MKKSLAGLAFRLLILPLSIATLWFQSAVVQAQTSPVVIPLQYLQTGTAWRLGINVGINGGTPQLYMFDTGSAVFNSAFNSATWGGFGPTAPDSTVPKGQNVEYCYGSVPGANCYHGNLVQVPNISFYAPGATTGSTPAVTLSASPGYQVNALYNATTCSPPNSNNCGVVYQSYPAYFQAGGGPPVLGTFYGIFGAGDFASFTNTGAVVGGVLGQTILPGVNQGYVVSANGQPNPATYSASGQPLGPVVNGPSGNQIVTVGGQTRPVSTTCTVCVTVGLTPQLIGQFAVPGGTGVVPWASTGPNFPNPYGGATGNNGSREWGANFLITVGSATAISGTLLDSGTPFLNLTGNLSSGGSAAGTAYTIVGVAPGGTTLNGLPTSSATLTGNLANYPDTYQVSYNSGATSTIGISFFMQNSVMFDLTGQTIGYTPFYVTAANLVTTANGPLIVSGANVPLGLAGVISGPGGVSIQAGGQVQLSATNTYTGQTTIAAPSGGQAAGLLMVSGPGSIASSSGVTNNGFFDISRAWAPVAVQTLSGNGQVYLGGGNLVLTNASTTYSGTLSDGGAYNVAGGSVTLAGGNFTLAGTGNYTGGTYVSGGNFTLTGLLLGGVSIGSNGSFTVASGGQLNNLGAGTFNAGQLNVSGTLTGNVANAGTVSGTGTIAGSLVNAGTISPGNSGIGTLGISSNYAQMVGGTHLVDVNGSGQSDLVNVGGAAALQGGTVYVYAQPGTTYAPVSTYRILSAAGGLTGTFSAVNELYPFLLSSLSYDANNAYLTLQIGGFAAAAATPTQAAVGAVLDANVNTASGDFAQVLSAMAVNVTSNAQGQAVLQSLSGNNYAGFSSYMVQGAQLFMNNFAAQAGGGGSPTSTRVALAEACDVACDTVSPPKWGAWGGGLGGLGTIGGSASVGAVTYNAGGFAAGLDRMVIDNLRVGVTAGYAAGTQWVNGFSGTGRSDTFQTGLYANFAQDKVYADALLGYAYTWNQMWRQITIPGLQPRTALGQTGVNQFFGQIETGYRFDLGTNAQAFITPFARLQGYTGGQNGFTETGAQSLNLTVAQQTTNSLRTVLGAQIGGAMDLGWREKLALVLRLGWSHEYADVSRPVTATLAGAPAMPFTTWGISPQRDGAVIGLSANTAIAEATSIYFRYEGNISGQDNAQAFTAGLRMTW